MVQWLRLHALSAGDTDSIPGPVIKILHTTKHGQDKIFKKRKKKETLRKFLGGLVVMISDFLCCDPGSGPG